MNADERHDRDEPRDEVLPDNEWLPQGEEHLEDEALPEDEELAEEELPEEELPEAEDEELAHEEWLPQDEELSEEEEPAPEDVAAEVGGGGEADAPPPATWAGRQGWSGLPDDPDAEDATPGDAGGDAPEPAEAAAGGEGEEPNPTVEWDTVALADQEAAREAALEGLRARTAEHAAKRGVSDPGAAAPPSKEAQAETGAEAKGDAHHATAGAAGAPKPADGAPAADGEEPSQPRLWARFVAASFLIIVSMATATSVSLLVYLTDIAKGLGGLEGLRSQLDAIDEKAQNFLILGSDVRPDEGDRGRSDTTMLLRVDPDADRITQLSIPRDLRVNVPGHGVDRFNTAYTYGGPKLTLKVVKQLTGDRVPIHHVVNVDFNGFADAVDAIECVYIDVDRHYFNDNSTVAISEQYAEIDIQAGYQRLCGFKALQYVRYRHEDNDIVRAARQQSFMREARQKVPPSKIVNERNELIDIFTSYTESDIDDTGTLVGLFKLMLDARNAGIDQIEFPTTDLGEESGYVSASDEGIRAAISDFLGDASDSPGSQQGGGGSVEGGGGESGGQESKPDPEPEPPPPPPAAELIDSSASGQQYSTVLAQGAGGELQFPILYPTRLVPSSSISDTDTRWFRIDGPGKKIYRGYKFVITFQPPPGAGYAPGYYGVSGTDWLDAPLFVNPSEEREIKGRRYRLYYDGSRLRMVAFQRADAMYWVTNSLDNLLTNEQMMGIAQNLAVPGG